MMKYEYIAGPGVIANVAYNLEMNTEFQTNTGVQYFIRVWINALGGNIPYGDTVPGKGLIVSNVAYDLYIGNHNGIRYITYVATQPVTHFDDDLLVFINELKYNKFISDNDYLVKLDAGTRIIKGSSATFTVKKFQAAIKIESPAE
ncbi:unnamed protein product [Peronospora belbahrii]|uniref:Uncharacterized protein n=1 Tax=Peronospora belbahrii TaxID=622444 RepID=A0ABN8CY11_9STRA|nr:unnamed protein product [Peronospora belbahrii]